MAVGESVTGTVIRMEMMKVSFQNRRLNKTKKTGFRVDWSRN